MRPHYLILQFHQMSMISLAIDRKIPFLLILIMNSIWFLSTPILASQLSLHYASNPPCGVPSVSPATATSKVSIDQPIIFVHGINQNACDIGVVQRPSSKDEFVPL